MRIRLIGAGNIGTALAEEANELEATLEIADRDQEKAQGLAERMGGTAVNADESLDEVDLVIEAATQDVVRGPVLEALDAGIDALVLTTGAFADPTLLDAAREATERTGAICHIPSGGIAAVDGVKALALDPDAEVTLTTRKPPGSLSGVSPDQEGEIFRGSAHDAVKKFPKNVNVAVSLLLAGIPPTVRLIADPSLDRNTHEVHITSPYVDVRCKVASNPSPSNPATSHTAVLSARAKLRAILDGFSVGT